MAFGIPTLYTITTKLPFTLSYKIYDIEQNGKPKLEEIIKIISKARAMASARSTDMAYNTSTKNIISTQLTFPINPVLTVAAPSAATPVAPASPTTITHRCSSKASGRMYPNHGDMMVSANHTTLGEFKSDCIGLTNPDCRVCKHVEATGNHRSGLQG
jgi:hypothetical protein